MAAWMASMLGRSRQKCSAALVAGRKNESTNSKVVVLICTLPEIIRLLLRIVDTNTYLLYFQRITLWFIYLFTNFINVSRLVTNQRLPPLETNSSPLRNGPQNFKKEMNHLPTMDFQGQKMLVSGRGMFLPWMIRMVLGLSYWHLVVVFLLRRGNHVLQDMFRFWRTLDIHVYIILCIYLCICGYVYIYLI